VVGGTLETRRHVFSLGRSGSKANVRIRRSRHSGCWMLIIWTASIAHSSQMKACGPATRRRASLWGLLQKEQAGVVIVPFECCHGEATIAQGEP
jgi:hypothetical protein